MTYDAIIIGAGAGAAGTYCAIHAVSRGLRVLLLDHNPEPGAKIRVSGGGRCNLTNTGARADTYYSHNPHFPHGALARHRPQDVLDWFGARGITWHEKHLGQIFADQRSRGILAALHDALHASGATLQTSTTLHTHQHDGDHYRQHTSRGDYRTQRLIIACGAPSYPKLGVTDLALRIAKQHHIANYPYRPAQWRSLPTTTTRTTPIALAKTPGAYNSTPNLPKKACVTSSRKTAGTSPMPMPASPLYPQKRRRRRRCCSGLSNSQAVIYIHNSRYPVCIFLG